MTGVTLSSSIHENATLVTWLILLFRAPLFPDFRRHELASRQRQFEALLK